jgi:hypothetical protein
MFQNIKIAFVSNGLNKINKSSDCLNILFLNIKTCCLFHNFDPFDTRFTMIF